MVFILFFFPLILSALLLETSHSLVKKCILMFGNLFFLTEYSGAQKSLNYSIVECLQRNNLTICFLSILFLTMEVKKKKRSINKYNWFEDCNCFVPSVLK